MVPFQTDPTFDGPGSQGASSGISRWRSTLDKLGVCVSMRGTQRGKRGRAGSLTVRKILLRDKLIEQTKEDTIAKVRRKSNIFPPISPHQLPSSLVAHSSSASPKTDDREGNPRKRNKKTDNQASPLNDVTSLAAPCHLRVASVRAAQHQTDHRVIRLVLNAPRTTGDALETAEHN